MTLIRSPESTPRPYIHMPSGSRQPSAANASQLHFGGPRAVAQFRASCGLFAASRRETKNALLVGCAGSPEPTCLSLQFGEMQGDFSKLQGRRRLIQTEGLRISMGCIGLSLIQGAGRPSFHSREGRFRSAGVLRRHLRSYFNVRFRAPFGHRRMAR